MELRVKMLEIVAKKVGMSHKFQENGTSLPLTFIKIYENKIIDFSINENKNFDSLTVGFEKTENLKKINNSVIGLFKKKSIPVFKKIKTSRIKKGSSFEAGSEINLFDMFKEGDKIDISGITSGKGFAGVMKRWNFRGLEASHGVSVSHRSHGSTGQRQDPGKVFKGKKMAGHMGVDKVTVKNLEIVIIDKENSLIAVKGSVPGNSGSDILIKTAKNF